MGYWGWVAGYYKNLKNVWIERKNESSSSFGRLRFVCVFSLLEIMDVYKPERNNTHILFTDDDGVALLVVTLSTRQNRGGGTRITNPKQ